MFPTKRPQGTGRPNVDFEMQLGAMARAAKGRHPLLLWFRGDDPDGFSAGKHEVATALSLNALRMASALGIWGGSVVTSSWQRAFAGSGMGASQCVGVR
jgi:hypothetical protein